MAQSTMLNVGEHFNLDAFTQQITESYQQKGFTVQSMNMGGSTRIVFDKDSGNILTGLGSGITASCMVNNGTLLINYTDGAWMPKLIAWLTNCLLLFIPIVGWILLIARLVAIVIGCARQYSLPKEIANDAMVIASNLTRSTTDTARGDHQQPQGPAPQQSNQMVGNFVGSNIG